MPVIYVDGAQKIQGVISGTKGARIQIPVFDSKFYVLSTPLLCFLRGVDV